MTPTAAGCHPAAQTVKIGGGGNRTRVPRYFRDGFYVRSRIISAFRPCDPQPAGFLAG